MNLADYLSELLGQYDEVSVPGLGYFVRERINGYYNDKEARFYPPHHKVKFVPQPKDDDTFAQYVADKKNISLASSKYFAEKFISKLKEQAATGKYIFADLGLFQTDLDQLVFKPYDKIGTDPAFYGYPELDIYKLSKPHGGDIKSAYAEPPAPSPVYTPPPVQVVEKQQYFEEETERKRPVNVWLIILIAITILALAAFGIYKFYPAAFDQLSATYNKITGKKEDTAVPVYRHEIKTDTIKKSGVPVKDTSKDTTAAVAPVTDSVQHSRFEIIADKLMKWRMSRAETEVKHLKSVGVDAKILSPADAPGPMIKISVGTYPDMDAAEAEVRVLEKSGKIKKTLDILEVKSHK